MAVEQLLLLAIFLGFAFVQALVRRWQTKRREELEAGLPPSDAEPPAESDRPWSPFPEAPPPIFSESPPPTREPPAYEPPTREPPAYEPPAYEPPAYEPPAYEPPAYVPPAPRPEPRLRRATPIPEPPRLRPPPPALVRTPAAFELPPSARAPRPGPLATLPVLDRSIVPRDRAALQRAVALMTILGPPRALDPPE